MLAGRARSGLAVRQIDEWSIQIEVPRGVRLFRGQGPGQGYSLSLAQGVGVFLHRVPFPPPASLQDARKEWRGTSLAEGVSREGVYYTVRVQRVPAGMPGAKPGPEAHDTYRAGRVYAVLPLGARSHIRCTGHVEYQVKSIDDPNIRRVRDICLSMKKATGAQPY